MDSINKLHQETNQPNGSLLPVIIALLVGLIVIVIFFFLKKRAFPRKYFLLTGLCDSGKTLIFSQFLYSKNAETFTSIAENLGVHEFDNKSVRVVDIPGHERLREKFFDQYKNSAKGVVFVVDSVTLQKDIKDVADYLYTVLIDSAISPCDILILCNKQDETLAKGASAIKTLLEKEINLVRKTRSSQLQSIDNSERKSVFLGREGQDFDFSHLRQNVQVLGCSAKENDLKSLADWIASA
ncbi:SRPRB family protein [Megaselia abdita]